MNELFRLPATELARLIRDKELSPVEVVEAHLARTEKMNPILNAVTDFQPARAREQAKHAERLIMTGNPGGRLCGVPLTIKSSIEVEGFRCECGTNLRKGV